MLLVGGAILFNGWPSGLIGTAPRDVELVYDYPASHEDFPAIASHYPATRIRAYRFVLRHQEAFNLDVVDYLDDGGRQHHAIAYLDPVSSPSTAVRAAFDIRTLRYRAWRDALAFIKAEVPPDALVVTWWDNAQRIHFMSGRSMWIEAPVLSAMGMAEREFWRPLFAGSESGDDRNRLLARWLAMDAGTAVSEFAKYFNRDVYIVVTLDDLARLGEIKSLAGRRIPLVSKSFAVGGDFHGAIAQVKRWAGEGVSGNYLLRDFPGYGVQAWRVENAQGADSLLVKLLPFTDSVAHPPSDLEVLYRSGDGAYLSVYRWQSPRHNND